jgi:hypothetical protein
MTNIFILDEIPYQPNLSALIKRLRVKVGHANALTQLVTEAEAIAKPKAMYKLAFIEEKNKDTVIIDGITFTSRVLRVNLDVAHRVFGYIATCGQELNTWQQSLDDMLFSYWADAIKEDALRAAIQYLSKHLTECYELGRTSTMAPGSLQDWPIREQKPLFSLLGNPEAAIGVQLTDSYLMIPNKSVSGIRFPTEGNFQSCQLCPRENCPGRRAEYDETLYDRKYKR